MTKNDENRDWIILPQPDPERPWLNPMGIANVNGKPELLGGGGKSWGAGGAGGGGSVSAFTIWNVEIDDTWSMVRDPEDRETYVSPPLTPPSGCDKVIIDVRLRRKSQGGAK